MLPRTKDAYRLMHEGVKALSQVEANGIRIDTDYLKNAIQDTTNKIKRLQEELEKSKISRQWRKHFGEKTNLGSRAQLGVVLFEIMGLKCTQWTPTGRPTVDVEVLSALKIPFVDKLLEVERCKKVRSTYLRGILREVDSDGFLHPFFNLHIPVTYRGSSDHPNFQNMPIRNPEYAELIRRAFIPRSPNHYLVEADYKGIEVCAAACYNQDPVLIEYIKDPSKDMHRDMALECFLLNKRQVDKKIRQTTKNSFVFPEFYGNIYTACATDLWNDIDRYNLKLPNGIGLKKHLRKFGIKRLGDCDPKTDPKAGSFEKLIYEVEQDFWTNRFFEYAEWKRKWYSDYQSRGYIDTLTGFRQEGIFKRNEIINYPIQGSAFHCLLWSLIQLVKTELRKYKLKSKIIGQIHDSIVGDVPNGELRDYIQLLQEVMVDKLRKHWKWIIVPLTVEFEVAPKGKSWFEKKEYICC
jgi:DNA polymerase-1